MVQLDLDQLKRHEIVVIDIVKGTTMWVFRSTLETEDFMKTFGDYIEVCTELRNRPTEEDFCDFMQFHTGSVCIQEDKLLAMVN